MLGMIVPSRALGQCWILNFVMTISQKLDVVDVPVELLSEDVPRPFRKDFDTNLHGGVQSKFPDTDPYGPLR